MSRLQLKAWRQDQPGDLALHILNGLVRSWSGDEDYLPAPSMRLDSPPHR